MPLRPAREGRVGVIRAPVAKTAVVAKAVTPGPAPVAKLPSWPRPSHPGGVGASNGSRPARAPASLDQDNPPRADTEAPTPDEKADLTRGLDGRPGGAPPGARSADGEARDQRGRGWLFGSARVRIKSRVRVFKRRAKRRQSRDGLHRRQMRARWQNASTAWYSASFRTQRCGWAIRSRSPPCVDSARRAKNHVTKDLLWMHNNGSTPQS